MSEIRHTPTPGPWKIGTCNDVGIFNGSYAITAQDPMWPEDPEERVIVCRLPTGTGDTRQTADAELIASAPGLATEVASLRAQRDELLAACKEALGVFDTSPLANCATADYLRTVIDRARVRGEWREE